MSCTKSRQYCLGKECVYRDKRVNDINTLPWENSILLNVTAGDACFYH